MPEPICPGSFQGCGGLCARVSKNIHDQKDEDSSGEHTQEASECRVEGLEPPYKQAEYNRCPRDEAEQKQRREVHEASSLWADR